MLASAVVFLLAQTLWVGCTTALALLAIKHLAGGLRVGLKAEMKGIDQSQHGGRSYTEFQTTVFTFKTPSGGEHSMEMRVRAGDAAKFAMALSEVMEGSTGSGSGGGSGGGRNAFGDVQAGGHAVYINDQPVDLSEMRRKASLAEEEGSRRADSESGSNPPSRESSGRSRGGSGRGGGFWDAATTRHRREGSRTSRTPTTRAAAAARGERSRGRSSPPCENTERRGTERPSTRSRKTPCEVRR